MSGFDRVVKYLDLRRATRDTTENLKPLTLFPARAIRKLGLTFNVPAFAGVSNPGFGTLFRQYNYTASQDFYVLKVTGYSPVLLAYAMCIKYRINGTVFRYRLPPTRRSDDYTNQVIKRNFCIEFWSSSFAGNIVALEDYTIHTSLIRNPVNADEEDSVVGWGVAETMDRDALAEDFPEALPTVYQSGSAWLTN